MRIAKLERLSQLSDYFADHREREVNGCAEKFIYKYIVAIVCYQILRINCTN